MASFDEDPESQSVEYEPVGVKDLLVSMKDSAELLVDIAYSALLNDSEPLAEEVLALEREMDVLQIQTRMNMLLAARSIEDAKQLAPVLGMVGGTEKISDAAGEIASIVLEEQELSRAIRTGLPEAMEVLARAEIDPDSPDVGETLGDLKLETDTGVRVIARRGAGNWELDLDAETTLRDGDIVLLRGAAKNLAGVYERLTGNPYEAPPDPEHQLADLTRAVDTILLMKDVSELAIDLAYASVLFDDEDLAREVQSLEVEVDALQARLEVWTLQAAAKVDDPVQLRGFIRLAHATELLSDAALEIAEGVLRDIDTHPVIAESVRESDVAIRRIPISGDGPLDGRTVGDIGDEFPGVSSLAVRRNDGEWAFYPEAGTTLKVGDVLIVRGTWDATRELLESA